ncbi:YjcZ family sporulation protein [Bacillus sp. CGMCC 1.16607]
MDTVIVVAAVSVLAVAFLYVANSLIVVLFILLIIVGATVFY